MTLGSILRYRSFRIRLGKNSWRVGRKVAFNLKAPYSCRITIREIPSDHHVFREVFEEKVYSSVVSEVRNCRCILDLGAHIGLSSIYLAAHFPEAVIVSLEPNRSNFELLKKNLGRLESQGRCQTMNAAIWSHDKGVALQSDSRPDWYSAFTAHEGDSVSANQVEVRSVAMEDVFKISQFDHFDLLKMDIEGAEQEVFKGDAKWLEDVRALAIEFHGKSRAEAGIDRIMKMRGFEIRQETRHTTLFVRA